jgi:hypothetical protein
MYTNENVKPFLSRLKRHIKEKLCAGCSPVGEQPAHSFSLIGGIQMLKA